MQETLFVIFTYNESNRSFTAVFTGIYKLDATTLVAETVLLPTAFFAIVFGGWIVDDIPNK